MQELAQRLALDVRPDPDADFIASIANDAELMEIAETDYGAAKATLIRWAGDTLNAYAQAIVAYRDEMRPQEPEG